MSEITVENAWRRRAVEAVVCEKGNHWLKVRPYGNCILFSALHESSAVRMGNVATINDGKHLKVHVTDIR